jgi:Flp pilus assembly protein CpaB
MTVTTGTLRVGILAIVAGLIGAYVIQQVLQAKPQVEAPPPALVTIPMATADLPEGRVIAMGDIAMVPMRQDEFAQRAADPRVVMVDPTQIIGRRLKQPIMQGDMFTTTSMFLEYSGPALSERLKPGYRAFSLSMPSRAAMRYSPGMAVDVMFRSTPRPAKDGQLAIPETTVTLLQNVEVIHVELPPPPKPTDNSGPPMLDLTRRNSRPADPPGTVTLAVTPHDAKVLQTVMGRGELTLSAWSQQDRVAMPESTKDGLTLEEILGIEPPPPPQVAAVTPPFITEVYRRGTADIRGYRRDAIFRFESPEKPQPQPLPAPAVNDK